VPTMRSGCVTAAGLRPACSQRLQFDCRRPKEAEQRTFETSPRGGKRTSPRLAFTRAGTEAA
jgi:hypothetical protein